MERYVAIGVAVLIVLFCAAIIWRDKPIENANTAVFMRILLSITCGILGGTISGFLNIDYSVKGLIIRAAGGFAVVRRF